MNFEAIKDKLQVTDLRRFIDYKTFELDKSKFRKYTKNLSFGEKKVLKDHLATFIPEYKEYYMADKNDPVVVEECWGNYEMRKDNFNNLTVDEQRIFLYEKYLIEERNTNICVASLSARTILRLNEDLRKLVIKFIDTGKITNVSKGLVSTNRIMDELNIDYPASLHVFATLARRGDESYINSVRGLGGHTDFLRHIEQKTSTKIPLQ